MPIESGVRFKGLLNRTALVLHTKIFGEQLASRGFDFYSGVPCSYLQHLINYAINERDYVMAANEGDAVAVCSGAYLGGRRAVFLCQNSGLTNAVSPLTSLNHIFELPILGFVSLRGEPGGPDEPQHELMGRITTRMLELMRIEWEFLAADGDEAANQMDRASRVIAENRSFFFVVRKGTFEAEPLRKSAPQKAVNVIRAVRSREDAAPARMDALAALVALRDRDTVVLATTGKTGRELYEIGDVPNNLYMVGSMGCVGSLALGLALAKPQKRVIAVDGDGALLMRMGSLATNAQYTPPNMLHILLDNNAHDSTGGQFTVSHNVDFISLAASVGYPRALYAHDIAEFERHIATWKREPSLTFLYLRIAPGSKKDLGRPGIRPSRVKERLMRFLDGDSHG